MDILFWNYFHISYDILLIRQSRGGLICVKLCGFSELFDRCTNVEKDNEKQIGQSNGIK